MSALDWCHWLENTAFAVSLKESAYLFPIVEGTHLLGMSVSVGLILLLDLRLLRVAFPTEPVSRIMRQVGPWLELDGPVETLQGFIVPPSPIEDATEGRLHLSRQRVQSRRFFDLLD